MKRIGFLLLSLYFVFSMACTGRARDGGTTTASQSFDAVDPLGAYNPPIAISTARTVDPTLQFDRNNPDSRSLDENRWYQAIRERMGIDLENKWVSPDSASNNLRWNAAMASGDLPDFANVTLDQYRLLYEGGFIADMTDIYANWATPDLKEIIPDVFFTPMTFDGRHMGFPLPNQAYHGGTLLFIRKDWLEQLNLPIPETYEEVIETAKKFQAANLGGNDTIGILFSNIINNDFGAGKWDAFFNTFGAFLDYWVERDGRAVYNATLPEMRHALLEAQKLYSDGIINRDFAAIRSQNVLEYIAAGRAGIAYSTSWSFMATQTALHAANPNQDLISIPAPPRSGMNVLYQTPNQPQPYYIFVNTRSRYPEAAVKIANLVWDIQRVRENYTYFISDDTTFWFKFIPWGERFVRLLHDLENAAWIRDAEESGRFELTREQLDSPFNPSDTYNTFKLAKEGLRPWLFVKALGPGGFYAHLYDIYQSGQILDSVYKTIPTRTMALMGDTLYDELNTSIFDVIMGADIAVFDRAVERWKINGGNQITEEVNDWYRNVRR